MTRDEIKSVVRPLETVEEGITKINRREDGSVYAEYQPGNGWKYRFLCASLKGLDVSGGSDEHFMVSFFGPATECWKSYPFVGGEGHYISPDYVADKLSLESERGRIDVAIFCEVIPFLVGSSQIPLERILDFARRG